MKDYNIILTVVPASSIAFFLKTNEASWLTIFSNSSLIKGVIGLSAQKRTKNFLRRLAKKVKNVTSQVPMDIYNDQE